MPVGEPDDELVPDGARPGVDRTGRSTVVAISSQQPSHSTTSSRRAETAQRICRRRRRGRGGSGGRCDGGSRGVDRCGRSGHRDVSGGGLGGAVDGAGHAARAPRARVSSTSSRRESQIVAVELGELRRQPDLLDPARARQVDRRTTSLTVAGPGGHHHDPVGERDRLGEVVGDEDDGRAGARPQVEQLVLHELAGLHVERAERLVHQQDRRLVDQRLGQRDALAHAAGELVGVVVLEAGQADPLDPVAGPVVAPRPWRHRGSGGRRRRCRARSPGQHGVGLEHVADAVGDAGDRRAVDERPSPADGGCEARRPARASWTCRSRWGRRRRRTRPAATSGRRRGWRCRCRRPLVGKRLVALRSAMAGRPAARPVAAAGRWRRGHGAETARTRVTRRHRSLCSVVRRAAQSDVLRILLTAPARGLQRSVPCRRAGRRPPSALHHARRCSLQLGVLRSLVLARSARGWSPACCATSLERAVRAAGPRRSPAAVAADPGWPRRSRPAPPRPTGPVAAPGRARCAPHRARCSSWSPTTAASATPTRPAT